jgi:ABC-2 type transport system ATP-binding protein
MNEYAIRTTHLTRDFDALRALDDLTLEVPSGIVFGFLGPNGSGKTTTIRLLLGLLEPTSGQASVLGLDTLTQGDELRARCGALLEHHGLYERLTAYHNLDYYGQINRMSTAERASRIEDLLHQLGLWDRRDDMVVDWSKGMKQKLAIARALLHRPALLFLDEPTSGLDAVAAAALRDDLAALAAHEGTTIFLTTHNLVEAERLCAQVAVIREGKLLATGSPDTIRARAGSATVEIVARSLSSTICDELRQQPGVQGVTRLNDQHLSINLDDKGDPAPLVTFLVHQGAQIEEVRRGSASLEEAFLHMVEDA